MDEHVEPPGAPEPAAGDTDRLEALEHQVRHLTSRLAGWVEAQLVQAVEDRRADMRALRNELELVLDEHLAGLRAESSSVLSVATRRLEVAQEQLGERLEAAQARGAESDERQRAELEALRAELRAAATEVPQRAARLVPSSDGMEQRVRSAMSRLSESVEARLGEVAAARQADVDGLRAELQQAIAQQGTELRTEVTTAASAMRARVGQVQERMDGLETLHREADERVTRLVEAKLAEVVDKRRSELDAMKWELQEALAKQLSDARAEIGTSVSDAHRRFLDAVDRLDDRINTLGNQVATLAETLASDDRRVEALEVHTRRTDARLTDLVDTKLVEMRAELEEALAGQIRDARTEFGTVVADAHRRFLDSVERLEEQMAVVADQAQAASTTVVEADHRMGSLEEHTRRTDARLTDLVDAKLTELSGERLADLEEFRAQLRNALDAHLAETRADVVASVGEGRAELAEGAIRLDRREAALAQAEERLVQSVQAKLADLDDATERMLKAQDEIAAVAASAAHRAGEAQDEVRAALEKLGAQVDAIAVTTARAAFAEEGALAPVRSDVRQLRAQVDELVDLVHGLKPRARTAAATPTKAEERALELTAKRAAVARAVPAKVSKTTKAPKAVTKAATAAPRRRTAPQ